LLLFVLSLRKGYEGVSSLNCVESVRRVLGFDDAREQQGIIRLRMISSKPLDEAWLKGGILSNNRPGVLKWQRIYVQERLGVASSRPPLSK
jgi:hypothetical protein